MKMSVKVKNKIELLLDAGYTPIIVRQICLDNTAEKHYAAYRLSSQSELMAYCLTQQEYKDMTAMVKNS